MQFSNSILALALASLVAADSDVFGLLVIRSGSQFQNTGVVSQDGKFTVGGGNNYVEGVITDAGEYKLDDGSYAKINSDGTVTSASEGSKPFSIKGGYLAYDGSQSFAVDSSSNALLAGSGSNPIALRATQKNGQEAADFTPSGSSSSTNGTASNTSSATPSPSVVTQTDNGAGMLQAGLGAGLAAAAVLLI